MIKFGIIGAGWRSEFYLRIAMLVPDVFSVSGIYIRNPDKREEFKKKYNVSIFGTLDELLKTDFDFIVSCVNKDSICQTAGLLSGKGIPVLTETPVSTDGLTGKIQVAEQFHLMPRNQAYKSIIDSGLIGEVQQVQVSCCHDYHAASLIRFFLEITDQIPEKTTITLKDNLIRYNSRAGIIDPTPVSSQQKITVFNFGDKSAIYDFNFEQYFSEIRTARIVIRGSKGEIVDNKCTYLENNTVHSFEIVRNCNGSYENLNGFSLVNITCNGKVVYVNPFKDARLSDEEIAIATCLVKMKKYVDGGAEFYSPQSAFKDFDMMQV